METIFIETHNSAFGTSSNFLLLWFRVIDLSIDVFSERMHDILNVITKEKITFTWLVI